MYIYKERKIIKNEKRCRNGVPKSTRTRKDKSDGKYTKIRKNKIFISEEVMCYQFELGKYLANILTECSSPAVGHNGIHVFK